ncbi:hypothetical protein [Methanopyrus sp.]
MLIIYDKDVAGVPVEEITWISVDLELKDPVDRDRDRSPKGRVWRSASMKSCVYCR